MKRCIQNVDVERDLDRLEREYADENEYFSEAGKRAIGLLKKLRGMDSVLLHVEREVNPTLWICFSTTKNQVLKIRTRKKKNLSGGDRPQTLALHYENQEYCFGGSKEKKARFDQALLDANFKDKFSKKGKGDKKGTGNCDIADLMETENGGKEIDYGAIFVALDEAAGVKPEVETKAQVTDEKTWVAINARRGQPEFRKRLLKAYRRRCAVTGCKLEEALEAAHIIPYSEEVNYDTSRGILLRSDIHTLFDLHMISVDPASGKVVVCEKCKVSYDEFHGASLFIPEDETDRPNAADLMSHYKLWHQKNDAVG